MEVFQSRNVGILPAVGMASPAKIHVFSVRIVEFVITVCGPLDVNPGCIGVTESIIESDFEH
jgi:hypothetical protein